MKRVLDLLGSTLGLVASAPVLAVFMYLIWRQDGHSPFYVAPRVGINGRPFKMIKLRSMIKNADKSGVDSTAGDDVRITRVGQLVRKCKLDELPQLWNVFKGDMSLVGPRPNVQRETDLYTAVERQLLEVRPGITDFASIVFADEGEILRGLADPDIAYHQLIRPGKSLLGIFYVDHRSLGLDIQLIALTALAILSRERALGVLRRLLARKGASAELLSIAARRSPLFPIPPPGAAEVVTSREGRVREAAPSGFPIPAGRR